MNDREMSFALMAGVVHHSSHTASSCSVERLEMTLHTAPSVLIRAARGSDGPALARLAELDSSVVPTGELLVAETDGELIAALGDGGSIADPFRRTAGVVELLRLRAEGARHGGRRRSRALRPVARLHTA
jgi:hypothetical protein